MYSVKSEDIVPILPTEQKRNKYDNLLYVEDGNNIGYFVWIKNLSRLVNSQLSKHKYPKYICDLSAYNLYIYNALYKS